MDIMFYLFLIILIIFAVPIMGITLIFILDVCDMFIRKSK